MKDIFPTRRKEGRGALNTCFGMMMLSVGLGNLGTEVHPLSSRRERSTGAGSGLTTLFGRRLALNVCYSLRVFSSDSQRDFIDLIMLDCPSISAC